MSTTPITTATGNLAFLNAVDATLNQPGASPNPFKNFTPATQALAASPQQASTTSGAALLQQKSAGQYSNRQFVAPLSYQINVEGIWITVDLLGKKNITNNNTTYRSIASLSATRVDKQIIEQARYDGITRAIKELPDGVGLPSITGGTPTFNAAGLQFATGANAITNGLGNRYTQFNSLVGNNTFQNFSTLLNGSEINLGALASGVISSKIPNTQISQTLARIPGFSVATNALGNITGASKLFNMVNTPAGAADGLISNIASGLNLQLGLPSLNMSGGEFDLGSLPNDFNQITGIATDIFHNGPPTSLQGLISLEKQIKGIICNFKLPVIKLPSFDDITNFKFPNLEDIGKQIKKEFDDLKSNIINQLDIVSQLKEMIPDPEEIYDAVMTEITTCDNNPNAEKNSKSGKSGS